MTRPGDEPLDPFAGDADDPARELAALDDEVHEPLSPEDREAVLSDLEDLEVYEALLAPRGVKGLAVTCATCPEVHCHTWDLVRGSLRHLLDTGVTRVHEPAYAPDLTAYVSWDYARGFADAWLDDRPEDQARGAG